MSLNRDELEALLRRIAEASPSTCDELEVDQQGNFKLQDQLVHLRGLGLITSEQIRTVHDSRDLFIFNIAITSKGIEHLGQDGGLSRDVNTLNVRIDPEQFRQILLAKLDEAKDVSHQQRSELVEQIRKLPAKALGKLIETALSKGAEILVQQLPQLGTLLAQAAA